MTIIEKSLQVRNLLLCHFLLLALISMVAAFPASASARDRHFYVSPAGNDSYPGTKSKPFKTIQKGLKAHQSAGADGKNKDKTLWLAGGIYELNQPIVLGKLDSGLKVKALDSSRPPRLIGGRVVHGFDPMKDTQTRSEIPLGVRKYILVADLKSQGMDDYGRQKACGFGQRGTSPMELFVSGKRATLARYPNLGWLSIASVPGGKDGKTITAHLEAGRLGRWQQEAEPWLYGYWFHGWADRFLPVKSIEVKSKTIQLDQLHHYGLRKGQRFFAQNLLSELDSPGEYYIDRNQGKLYLYPEDTDEIEAIVSTLEAPILQIRNTSDVHVSGLHIEAGRGDGLLVDACKRVKVTSCRVANTGETGISVAGGMSCGISNCEVSDTGSSGIVLSGGNRKTLTASGHYATANHVHHSSRLRRTYTPCIGVNGVGNRVSQNLLHHVPHQAIAFNGNDHLIDRNEIHHAVLETDDAGAIYTCPRDYTSRGTVIRHNFIHHSGPHHAPKVPDTLRTEKNVVYEPMHIHGTSLIYLDDLTGGVTVAGNVLVGAYRALLIGGGRDNTIEGNLIIGGNIGIWIDGRGLGWAAKHVAKGGSHGFFRKYAAMKGDQPPYSTHYPGLATVLSNHPAAPVNTVARSNVILGAKVWKKTDGKSDPFIKFVENYHHEKAPRVATPLELLESINPSTLKKIHFEKIPFDEIGLH